MQYMMKVACVVAICAGLAGLTGCGATKTMNGVQSMEQIDQKYEEMEKRHEEFKKEFDK